MSGRLIVFEGLDGCGKTTQLRLAHERLTALGVPCVTTRDPGGTVMGEALREMLLSPEAAERPPQAELLLFCAARAELVRDVIRPALAEGKIVLSDRFGPSSVAYQGHAGGLGVEMAERLTDLATEGLQPDLTLIFDVDPEIAAARLAEMPGGRDRIERRGLDFQRRVREGYLLYAQRHADRCVLLDAGPDETAVAAEVWAHLERLVAAA